jgi:hypothetical protein
MKRVLWLPLAALAGLFVAATSADAQQRPYLGFAYPAGGQQGTTFQVRLGGQALDDFDRVLITGEGVTVKVVDFYRKLGPQEMTLISEQIRKLKPTARRGARAKERPREKVEGVKLDEVQQKIVDRIEARMAEYVNRPACASISSLAFIEVSIAADAAPGQRELRVITPRGVSNPLVFQIGQYPETCRKPMKTCDFQVLGKEELAQRKRPAEEVEVRIELPSTVNGQIASGEENLYRFAAKKGQRLVIACQARQLIPYIADAVPGWFQPVLTLRDAQGKEVAYNDDYRFHPDPVIFYEVPADGELVLSITDAIYRGREDFVYRVSIGETPFVTSIFPLGAPAGAPVTLELKGWNLDATALTLPAQDSSAGIQWVTATKKQLVSNRVPFARDSLPEIADQEPNDDLSKAREVKLPVIVNGRIDRPDDWDVFRVAGRAGEKLVAEVYARRLDSPLDSMIRITDAKGNLLAFGDDNEDAGSGVNTHHADAYLSFEFPADGDYFVHLSDAARDGGDEYAYRLRLSAPRPDFALRVVPSSISVRRRASTSVSVFAIRKDGFTGDIRVQLKDPPKGVSAKPVTLSAKQDMVRLSVAVDRVDDFGPVNLLIEGQAKIGDADIAHVAVPAEDRMQAFLWRHLVPAERLELLVFDSSSIPPPKREVPPPLEVAPDAPDAPAKPTAPPQFTKKQVAGRLRQLGILYQDWLLTEEFYQQKVAECEAME